MNPLEAMQRLISMADELTGTHSSQRPISHDQKAQEATAVAVIQRMLNTATPVAKYRCFVEVDSEQPRRRIPGSKKSPILDEFIVSGVSGSSILSGLIGLSEAPLAVRITLWEQRATGAEMLLGFQGQSKTKAYRAYLQQILDLDRSAVTIQ